jgi:hypothetical protein
MNGKEWYSQQLSKPEWKAKRKQIYNRDSYSCVDCRKRGVTINCHHNHYVTGKMPWDYPDYALETVCNDCHQKRHKTFILTHASHEDAEMWYLFADLEAAMLEEELKERRERIGRLEDQGTVWDHGARSYSIVDDRGRHCFFDEDGNEM